MTNKKPRRPNDRQLLQKTSDANITTFSFELGDPVPMTEKGEILNYLQASIFNGKYYEPPINLPYLSMLWGANAYHQSALEVKKKVLLSTIKTSSLLSSFDLEKFIQDFLYFGNGYLLLIRNKLQQAVKINALLAKYMRVGVDGDYYQIIQHEERKYNMNNVFHLFNPDINQDIYGVPSYLGAVQSLLLNESATLFRRKYYLNGAHAGSIIYLNDPAIGTKQAEAIRDELKNAKGKGNFKNLFLYAPSGKDGGIKVIPLADAAAKDEFLNIKNASRDDILAAHRVPPQLMGVLPSNVGGFGDTEKAARVFFINEIKPMQRQLERINEWLGFKVIHFEPYELLTEE